MRSETGAGKSSRVDGAAGVKPALAFVAMIPARLESTRLPEKALADIGGRAMVVRVAERARAAGAARVVVATDSSRIADVVRGAGFEVQMTRADHPSGTDRLAEAAEALALADEAIVVNVQGDEPLIDPHLIRAVAQCLHDDDRCALATAAQPIDEVAVWLDPNVVKVVCDRNGQALYFTRAPVPFARDAMTGFPAVLPATMPHAQAPTLRHIGIYAWRVRDLRTCAALAPTALERVEALEQLRALWHGLRIAVHIWPAPLPGGVDTAADLERVRAHWSGTQAGLGTDRPV